MTAAATKAQMLKKSLGQATKQTPTSMLLFLMRTRKREDSYSCRGAHAETRAAKQPEWGSTSDAAVFAPTLM